MTEERIKVSNVVFHSLSGLYYQCENKKQEIWMNANPYYTLAVNVNLPEFYFINSSKK